MLIVSDHRPNGPARPTQARREQDLRERRPASPSSRVLALPRPAAAFLVPALLLAGCASGPSINPVDWWHSLEGGPMADTRPPPPKADAPYPNLGSVPAKPTPPAAATRAAVASGLVADRTNAQYAASLAPIQPFAAAGSPPPPAAPRPPAAGDDQAMGATMAAASAPPVGPLGPPQPPLPNVPVTPPRKAPVAAVQAAPLAAPAVAAPAVAAPAAAPPAVPAASALAAATPAVSATSAAAAQPVALPGMSDQPPGQPSIPGVTLPKVVPSPPPETPKPVVAPAPPPKPGDPVSVAFVPGSATLPPAALVQLKALALRHGAQPIAVTGYGEAASSQAAAQSEALPLALARARVIATNLQAAGVAPADLRIGAEAQGQGGAARIVAP